MKFRQKIIIALVATILLGASFIIYHSKAKIDKLVSGHSNEKVIGEKIQEPVFVPKKFETVPEKIEHTNQIKKLWPIKDEKILGIAEQEIILLNARKAIELGIIKPDEINRFVLQERSILIDQFKEDNQGPSDRNDQ